MNKPSDIATELIDRIREESRELEVGGQVCYPYVAGRLEAMIISAVNEDPAVRAYFEGRLEYFRAKEVAQ